MVIHEGEACGIFKGFLLLIYKSAHLRRLAGSNLFQSQFVDFLDIQESSIGANIKQGARYNRLGDWMAVIEQSLFERRADANENFKNRLLACQIADNSRHLFGCYDLFHKECLETEKKMARPKCVFLSIKYFRESFVKNQNPLTFTMFGKQMGKFMVVIGLLSLENSHHTEKVTRSLFGLV